MFFLLLPYAIQIVFIVHALRNGKNTTWIWLLIMLPYVGGIIYFVMEIVPDLRRGRLVDPEGLLKLVDKSITVRRLKEKIVLSDTVANQLELADEYFRMGAFDDARRVYQSQLTGIYQNDRAIQLGTAKSAFLAGDFGAAHQFFQAADAQSKITSSELRLFFLFSKFKIDPTPGPLKELEDHFKISRDCRAGLFLSQAYHQSGHPHRIEEVLPVMRILVKNSRGTVRTQARKDLLEAETLLAGSQKDRENPSRSTHAR